GPPAAEGFDELNGNNETLVSELGATALSLEGVAAGVHNFEVTHEAGAIAFRSQFGGATGAGHGAVLRGGLVGEVMNAGEAVFDVAEGHEDLLAVFGHGFLVSGLGAVVVGAISAAGEDRQREARANGPNAAFPIE